MKFFTAKKKFWAEGSLFEVGKTYPVTQHTPDGPDHPAGKHCVFGETEAEAQEAYVLWHATGKE
jgi:hypothetical protein